LCAAFIAANSLAQKGDTKDLQVSVDQAKARRLAMKINRWNFTTSFLET